MALTELASRTALVKSTIMRLCISLEKFNLVERLADGRYRLGVEAARIGSVYQQSFAMEERIVPVLERLATDSQETASFYIRRGNERLCLFRVDSPHPLRMNVRPGDIRPMDLGAIAQVLATFSAKAPPSRSTVNLPLFTSGVTDPHVAALAMPVFGAGASFSARSPYPVRCPVSRPRTPTPWQRIFGTPPTGFPPSSARSLGATA